MSAVNIYLLGSGIRGALQFTTETIQALRACRVAYVLHDDLMVHEQVREWCEDVRDLADMYAGEAERAQVYHRISELLVEEGEREPAVAFVVHGHPLFLVSATEYTMALARERGLRVEVLPAVSSFDTILCDLGIDYGYGLQMFDATTMLRNGWSPNPEVPLLIFQIATTLNLSVVRGEPEMATLRPLVELLSNLYPSEHPCTVIHSAAHLLETPSRVDTQLGGLLDSPGIELWKRPTLYVPPLERNGITD